MKNIIYLQSGYFIQDGLLELLFPFSSSSLLFAILEGGLDSVKREGSVALATGLNRYRSLKILSTKPVNIKYKKTNFLKRKTKEVENIKQ